MSCKHCGIGGDYEEHVVSYLPLSHIAAQVRLQHATNSYYCCTCLVYNAHLEASVQPLLLCTSNLDSNKTSNFGQGGYRQSKNNIIIIEEVNIYVFIPFRK